MLFRVNKSKLVKIGYIFQFFAPGSQKKQTIYILITFVQDDSTRTGFIKTPLKLFFE